MFKVDKNYCMNSFLQFRYVFDKTKIFKKGVIPNYTNIDKKYIINNANDVENRIKDYIIENVDDKTVLMLSSGIDSAIIAKYVPIGTMTFTLKCIAEEKTIDETERAKEIANINNLKNEIVEVTWEDYQKYIPELLNYKKAPFHSIEVQIYKAALRAKELGYTKLLFGESADIIFGGLDGLLSKDWSFDEFVDRYNYVPINKVLKEPNCILEPYNDSVYNGKIDVYRFVNKYFFEEAINSYIDSCSCAGIEFLSPFSEVELGFSLDLNRIRNGEGKYLLRELFKKLYPDLELTKKIPMPRPINLWLKNWDGPQRKEFINECQKELTGDQKWLIYILERFLNQFDVEE